MIRTPLLLTLIAILICGCKQNSHQQTDSSTGRSSKGFDELSSDYYDSELRVIWQKPDMVLGLLGNLRGKTIADIGAGTGFFAFRIANAGGKVIAIDIDPRAIAYIESEKLRYTADVQALLETRLAAPDNPNLRPNEVDVILMVNTYIYLPDRITYFRNLQSGLKRNARVIIIDFKDIDTPIGPGPDERISLSRIKEELTEAGYVIISSDEESLEYQYVVIGGVGSGQ
jgi:SAM-dependent methyltransferase